VEIFDIFHQDFDGMVEALRVLVDIIKIAMRLFGRR